MLSLAGASQPLFRMQEVWRFARELPAFETAASLTLILIFYKFTGTNIGPTSGPGMVLALLGLFFRPLIFNRWFWASVLLFLIGKHVLRWHLQDNHDWLLIYWVLALCLACGTHQPDLALARTGRLLIGLCFALAVIAKLRSPEFINGVFFEVTAWTDWRFAGVIELLGGQSPQAVASADAAVMQALTSTGTAVLPSVERVRWIARAFTAWALAIEVVVALTFLFQSRLQRWRDPALLVFMHTIYPVAPVVGFGWLLCVLGLVQAPVKVRAFYLLSIAVMPFYYVSFLSGTR
jgi:hypothetical protein